MPVNTNPTQSIQENYSKYAQYFSQDENGSVVSVDTFFQLLLAEMTNQDPLEPTSNTEFVSQLASFTALQTNEDNLYYNTVSYASSLTGKTVTVATQGSTKDKLKIETGVVTGVDISDKDQIEITINGNRYKLGSIMNVAPSDGTYSAAAGTSNYDGAYAVSLIGKQVVVRATDENGANVLDSGTVETIEAENGVYRVVIGGYSYTLDSIVKVNNPPAASTPASTDKNTDTDTKTDANTNQVTFDGAYAVSLIGKRVFVRDENIANDSHVTSGIVKSIDFSDGKYLVNIGSGTYSLESVLRVASDNQAAADGAYAVSLIGKEVEIYNGGTDESGSRITGVVESVVAEDGTYYVTVNGNNYSVDLVVKVSDPAENDNNTDETDKNIDNIDNTVDETEKGGNEEEKSDTTAIIPDTENDEETETSIMEENEALKELFS